MSVDIDCLVRMIASDLPDRLGPKPAALLRLVLADELLRGFERWERALVGEARRQKMTWAAIGGALGVTKQAAWQRFGP